MLIQGEYNPGTDAVTGERQHLCNVVRVFAVMLLFLGMLVTGKVHAAAGDLIQSTATIEYTVTGINNTTSATASFSEDRIINFTVSDDNGGAAVPVVSNMVGAVMQFTVTNLGNDTHDFLLAAMNTTPNPYGLPADNFDPVPASMQVFVESGATPGYQSAQDTGVYIDELAATASQTVYLVANIPAVSADDVAAVALIAQVAQGGAGGVEGAVLDNDDNSHASPAGIFSNGSTVTPGGSAITNPNTVGTETVFNDPAGLQVEDISTAGVQDIVRNGQHSDAGAFQVAPAIALIQSVTVIDTLGGNDPHPGATLRYQTLVTVNGNVPVDDLVISNPIPVDTTYTLGTITLDGLPQTDANDAPADYSQAIDVTLLPGTPVSTIEVDLSQGGTVSALPTETYTITFDVTID